VIILGIDPGLAATGLAAIDRSGPSARWIAGGELRTDPAWTLQRRLWHLREGVEITIAELAHAPQPIRVDGAVIEAFEVRAGGGSKDRRACSACGAPGGKAAGIALARFRRAAGPHYQAMGALICGLGRIHIGPPIRAVDWHRRLKLKSGDPKGAAAQFAAAAIQGLPAGLADHVTDAACIALAARIVSAPARG